MTLIRSFLILEIQIEHFIGLKKPYYPFTGVDFRYYAHRALDETTGFDAERPTTTFPVSTSRDSSSFHFIGFLHTRYCVFFSSRAQAWHGVIKLIRNNQEQNYRQNLRAKSESKAQNVE
jgi:hypothetical protein